MTSKAELFAAYGDDARAALDAWPNLDPTGYAMWSEKVEERQYLAEYRRWFGRQTLIADRNLTREQSGQDSLPGVQAPASKVKGIRVRSGIVHDGSTVALTDLAGHEGAQVLRQAMLRDLNPASTTVDRCHYGIAVADQMDAETERLGRPVTASEVMHLVASAA